MKIIKNFSSTFTIISFVTMMLSQQVLSKQMCAGLFYENQAYQNFLADKTIPAADVKVNQKSILTVLVNSKNYADIAELYENSIGIITAHQKGYSNDHGMMRVGQYFVDRDLPGHRGRGEINLTGISWVNVKGYLDYAYGNKTTNRVEVLFQLTATEMQTAQAYQKMRRAAIVRPDFTFGRGGNPEGVNNILKNCGEMCFTFSTGSALSSQISALRKEINKIGIANADAYIAEKDVQSFLEYLTQEITKSSIDEKYLNPDFARRYVKPAAMKNLNPEQVNWVFGYYVSLKYGNLLKDLSIQNSMDFSNVRSPRATAIVVYDSSAKTDDFLKAEYQSEGVFSTWKNTDLTVLQNDEKQPVTAKDFTTLLRKLFQ